MLIIWGSGSSTIPRSLCHFVTLFQICIWIYKTLISRDGGYDIHQNAESLKIKSVVLIPVVSPWCFQPADLSASVLTSRTYFSMSLNLLTWTVVNTLTLYIDQECISLFFNVGYFYCRLWFTDYLTIISINKDSFTNVSSLLEFFNNKARSTFSHQLFSFLMIHLHCAP